MLNNTASNITAVGGSALLLNQDGGDNVAVGFASLTHNLHGTDNTGIGYQALNKNTAGTNTAVGSFALSSTVADGNTAIGYAAGNTNTSGTYNTFIGTSTQPGSNNLTNATAIGANAIVSTSNSLVLGSSANVGIGTSSPAYPLDIGTSASYPSSTYGYLSSAGTTTTATGTIANVSLRATGQIVAAQFDAVSDMRVKEIMGLSDNKADLERLLKLRVTDYHYIDKIANGPNYKKGFIAQEVEKVYPEAVDRSVNYIPNIFSAPQSAKYDEATKEIIITVTKPHELGAGDMVKIVTERGNKEVQVARVTSANSFVLENWTDGNEKLFVYGKQVKDFRTVDYERLFTLGVSSIQELSKQIDLLKAENERLKNDNATLKTGKADAGDVTQLKLQLEELRKLMQQNGIRTDK